MGEIISVPTEGSSAEIMNRIVANYINARPNCVLHVGVFRKGVKRVYKISPLGVFIDPPEKTFYEIGSITKTVTATAMAILIQNSTTIRFCR
jgi:CubicO group peptidase (beta-lactamase class C family)